SASICTESYGQPLSNGCSRILSCVSLDLQTNETEVSIMKIKIAVMMCAALGLPGVIFGQHHAPPAPPTAEQSITGDWVIHFQAGHESVSGSLRLEADGERLAGTVETGHTG